MMITLYWALPSIIIVIIHGHEESPHFPNGHIRSLHEQIGIWIYHTSVIIISYPMIYNYILVYVLSHIYVILTRHLFGFRGFRLKSVYCTHPCCCKQEKTINISSETLQLSWWKLCSHWWHHRLVSLRKDIFGKSSIRTKKFENLSPKLIIQEIM